MITEVDLLKEGALEFLDRMFQLARDHPRQIVGLVDTGAKFEFGVFNTFVQDEDWCKKLLEWNKPTPVETDQ